MCIAVCIKRVYMYCPIRCAGNSVVPARVMYLHVTTDGRYDDTECTREVWITGIARVLSPLGPPASAVLRAICRLSTHALNFVYLG